MNDKMTNIDFNAENLAFLEQIEDKSVLKPGSGNFVAVNESDFNFDELESLDETSYFQAGKEENTSLNENTPIIMRRETVDYPPLKEVWGSLWANMSDVVTKIFELSDRPMIVIRDDKIAYMNKTAMAILELTGDEDIIGHSFWNFVDKPDWQPLSENIGPMLTEDKIIEVRLKTYKERIYKIKFQAMYLEDEQHFTFVLVGSRKIKYNPAAGLYDAVTGLPNFYLFEDRVQIAINNEKYKDIRQRRNMMAVLGVSIDNLEELKKVNMVDFVLKKLASKLVFRLKKSYTIARGLKYQFWILINDFNNQHDLDVEIEKIKAIFDEPVSGNYMDYNILTSFGRSIYPDDAQTANKLIELAIEAINNAVRSKQN